MFRCILNHIMAPIEAFILVWRYGHDEAMNIVERRIANNRLRAWREGNEEK